MIINPTFRPVLTFITRRKSAEIRQMQIDVRMLPKMASLFIEAATAGSVAENDLLKQAGVLIPADEAPREVAQRLPLSDASLALLSANAPPPPANTALNSDNVFVQRATPRPDAPSPGIPPWNNFPTELPLTWVFDPGTRMWAAYNGDIDERLRDVSWHARVFVDDEWLRARHDYWVSSLDEARASIERDGYAVLRDVLPPLQIAALRGYVRALEEEGYLLVDHIDVPEKRFVRHNDEVFRFIHRQTGYLMRRITSEMIIPSYCYLSAYREDAELPRHKDRPQCVWNVSLLVDTNREGTPWPIFLETKNGLREVRLGLGDAVVYRGAEVAHWRPKAAPGARETLALMHYVPFDFTGDRD